MREGQRREGEEKYLEENRERKERKMRSSVQEECRREIRTIDSVTAVGERKRDSERKEGGRVKERKRGKREEREVEIGKSY